MRRLQFTCHWFYLYLVNVRGIDLLRGGWLAAAPTFVAILVFCPLGGWIRIAKVSTLGLTKARMIVSMIGMGLAGGLIAVGAWADSRAVAIASLAGSRLVVRILPSAPTGSNDGRSLKSHAGTLSGVINMGAT
ncbi:MAG: hypothetical protein IPM88_19815 [Nitrospira sp.]|nr:hypothetical protein [Nitrospira sp.]